MTIDKNTFAFTSWLMKNTHVETETGLTEFDGYEWYNYMWEKWLENSDAGKQILNQSGEITWWGGNTSDNPGTITNNINNSLKKFSQPPIKIFIQIIFPFCLGG